MRRAWNTWASSFFLFARIDVGADGVDEPSDCLQGAFAACFYDRAGHLAALFQFAVDVEYLGYALFGEGVDQICRRAASLAVHPHVEGSVEAEGETAFGVIEVVEGDSEVGQHSVNFSHVIVAHEVCDEAEVGVDHRETGVGGGAAHRILVLVEGIEHSAEACVETLHDGA